MFENYGDATHIAKENIQTELNLRNPPHSGVKKTLFKILGEQRGVECVRLAGLKHAEHRRVLLPSPILEFALPRALA